MILDADMTVAPRSFRSSGLPWSRRKESSSTAAGSSTHGAGCDAFGQPGGNKLFGRSSVDLDERVTDTLCGSKACGRGLRRIAENRRTFGDFDPFGDFDLLFGAANLN
jgi:hypothetical protein